MRPVLLSAALACIGPLLCGPAAAADGAPPWTRFDDPATTAEAADPVNAIVSSIVRERQLNPLRAARLYAGVRVAQAEALRTVTGLPPELVARLAAAKAMTWLLPLEDAARWTAPALAAAQAMGGVPAGADARIDAAIVPVLHHLLQDGADARRQSLAKPPPGPGIWGRTPSLFAEQPAEPQGATWRPWCPGSDRVDVPPAVPAGTPQWREELRQALDVSRRLTDDDKRIAARWHLDAGSVTPPGVWNLLTVNYMATQEAPPARQRVLAVLNMAMQDALVAAWRIKLRDWSERPVTAIRRELDPGFEPYLATPPFPGYVSGHSTVSAAAATVLAHYFPAQAGTWHALAREAALSRLYGGIHFQSDNEQGLALGRQVAQRCLAAFEATAGAPAPLVNRRPGTPEDFFVLPRTASPRD